MRCKTNCTRAANALFISFSGLCLLHAPAGKQDFHHKNDLFLPKIGENARCKRGVNCMRDGQKCLILQGKSAFVRGFPWQMKSIRVILKHLQKSRILPRFAAICEPDFSGCSLQQCHDLAEIRQNAANHGRQW